MSFYVLTDVLRVDGGVGGWLFRLFPPTYERNERQNRGRKTDADRCGVQDGGAGMKTTATRCI